MPRPEPGTSRNAAATITHPLSEPKPSIPKLSSPGRYARAVLVKMLWSAVGELGLPLLEERLHAGARIDRAGDLEEQVALDLQTIV